jgi:hypothetical protein
MESSVDYMLETPIQVAIDGGLEDVQMVELVAPAKKVLRKTYRLQQYMTRAMLEASEMFAGKVNPDAPKGEEKQITGTEVKMMLLASTVDIEACLGEFEKLAFAGCLKVNDKTVNAIQFGKIADEDLEGLMVEFLANFIMPLVMKSLEKL